MLILKYQGEKKMKKLLSVVLAVVIVMCMTCSAYARGTITETVEYWCYDVTCSITTSSRSLSAGMSLTPSSCENTPPYCSIDLLYYESSVGLTRITNAGTGTTSASASVTTEKNIVSSQAMYYVYGSMVTSLYG